jgi:hypothetical protein
MLITYESPCIKKQATLHTVFYHCATNYRTLQYYNFYMSVRHANVMKSVSVEICRHFL